MRHYNPPHYSDEDRSDGRYYSSESPEETDSEYDDYRERGPGRGYYVSDDRAALHPPDSESSSEGVPDSESETETDECSDRYVPEEYEPGPVYYDRDDHDIDSYGDPYEDWDGDDYDEYGEYDCTFALFFTRFPTTTCTLIPRLR